MNILDVNSLYPSVMRYELLPYGEPVFFEGEYKYDNVYPLYIQKFTCSFRIKKNKIPTIQMKGNSRFLVENEYLLTSETDPLEDDTVCLILTNIDLELFFSQYDVYNYKPECGWKFKGMQGLFNEYIDKWIERKNQGTLSGNEGQRTLAKLMLNSLYGKFATSLETASKIPWVGEDEIVHYNLSDKESKKGVYLPMRKFYYCLCKT